MDRIENHPELLDETRSRLLGARMGSLSTLSLAEGIEGYPFGSLAPYALTRELSPVFFLSGLAEHTRNLRADPRASLLIRDPETREDPQRSWRLTLVGRLVPVQEEGAFREELVARFLERVPGASLYLRLPDFHPWVMEVERVRSIAGFGRIHWVPPGALGEIPGAAALTQAAPGILEHMNEDHGEALRDLCRGLRGQEVRVARIESLDSLGFLVRTHGPDGLHWFSFPEPLQVENARKVFVELTREAREALQE